MSDGAFVRIPPSADARQGDAGRSWPDRIEFLPGPPPRLKVGTIETPDNGTLMRFFDQSLAQVEVVPTDPFRILHQKETARLRLPSLDSEEFRRSVETLRYRVGDVWVTKRRPDWGRKWHSAAAKTRLTLALRCMSEICKVAPPALVGIVDEL